VAELFPPDTVELDPDFLSAAWRKLLVNAAVGLMVLSGRRSGMFRRDDVAALAREYLAECLAVARAEGATLGNSVIDEIVDMLARSPEDLTTSMLTDREAGRPLEWDIRNGVIRRKGAAHGLPTPISDVVVPLLAAAGDGPG
jgi:2-dehydropantoate 2-reductase